MGDKVKVLQATSKQVYARPKVLVRSGNVNMLDVSNVPIIFKVIENQLVSVLKLFLREGG